MMIFSKTKACLFAIISMFVFLGCSEKEEASSVTETMHIDLSLSKPGKLSDQFESIQYTLLDFQDSLPVVRHYKTVVKDSLIFMEDRDMANLFIFDRDGKVRQVIRSTGMGPGEFYQTEDFQVKGDRIYIEDAYLDKMLLYDFQGNFIEEWKTEFDDAHFYFEDAFKLYYLKNDPVFDRNGFVLEKNGEKKGFLPIKKGHEQFRHNGNIGLVSNAGNARIFMNMPFTFEVAAFDKATGELDEHIYFDLGNAALSEEDRLRYPKPIDNQRILENKNQVNDIGTFLPFKNRYYLSLNQGLDKQHYLFLDSLFEVTYQATGFENDIDGMKIRNIPWACTKDELVYVIHSSAFYQDYLEKFSGQKVAIASGNIHDFVDKNEAKLQEDKLVMVFLKLKEE